MLLLPPLVAMILGVLMYALATNPKLAEIGRLLFFAGLFWVVALAGSTTGHPLRFG